MLWAGDKIPEASREPIFTASDYQFSVHITETTSTPFPSAPGYRVTMQVTDATSTHQYSIFSEETDSEDARHVMLTRALGSFLVAIMPPWGLKETLFSLKDIYDFSVAKNRFILPPPSNVLTRPGKLASVSKSPPLTLAEE
jgi:hypothetical protein